MFFSSTLTKIYIFLIAFTIKSLIINIKIYLFFFLHTMIGSYTIFACLLFFSLTPSPLYD